MKYRRVSLRFKKHLLKSAIHIVLASASAFNAVALAWPWKYCSGFGLGLVTCGLVNIPAIDAVG